MSRHAGANGFVVRCELRLASRSAQTRRRLTGRSPTANDLGHVGYADQKHPRRRTDTRSCIDRRNHAFTQILGIGSAILAAIGTATQNHKSAPLGIHPIPQNVKMALAERAGLAKLHLDLRRGDGPPGARYYNFAALTTTDALIEKEPEVAAAAVRAIVTTQKALKADPLLAKKIGDEVFPGDEAELMPTLVARDAPFYDATITAEAVAGINTFAKTNGLIDQPLAYEQIVAAQFSGLWQG